MARACWETYSYSSHFLSSSLSSLNSWAFLVPSWKRIWIFVLALETSTSIETCIAGRTWCWMLCAWSQVRLESSQHGQILGFLKSWFFLAKLCTDNRLPKASGWDYAAATERWQTSLQTDNSKQKTFTRVQQRWILQYDFIWFVWFCRTSWFTSSLLVVNLCAALWIQKSKESPSSQSCGIQPAARCPVLMRFTWGSHEIPHVLMSVTFCPLILFENHWKPIWSYSLLSSQPAQALPVGDLGPAQIVAPVVALYGGLWFKRCVQGDSVSFHVCINVGWFLFPPSKGEYVSPIFEATPMYESGLQSNYRLIYQMQHALRCMLMYVWMYIKNQEP